MEEQLTLKTEDKKTKSVEELRPRISVIGVGGAGGNAVNNMIRYQLEGVDFIISNTDAQALTHSLAEKKIQLGLEITQGLGAGSRPDVGKAAAEETLEETLGMLKGSHMLFITAGMGGGTGTGAAPVIAKAAREMGILTVGVVTKPFHFEGSQRMKIADSGIQELQQYVDTLIIIPNQNLFRVANERTTFADAFKMADDVLYSGVRGITDLMIMPGLINLDFADVRSVMSEMGKAMMGTGEAEGENRAIEAAEAAISNPLLDDVSMKGAKGVLINITGGLDMTLFEVDEAANRIRQEVDPSANIIFGSTFDEKMEGVMRVSVVATGIDAEGSVRGSEVTSFFMGGRSKANEPEAEVVAKLKENADESDMANSDSDSSLMEEALEIKSEQLTLDKTLESSVANAKTHAAFVDMRSQPKVSFFKKLFGGKQPSDDYMNHHPRSHMDNRTRSVENYQTDKEEELEIPAFLRRKK